MLCRVISDGRILFALAGSMTLLAVGLTVLVSPWFLLLAVFVAANQWLYASVGACPASLIIEKVPCATEKARLR